jgi:hypothetical protein
MHRVTDIDISRCELCTAVSDLIKYCSCAPTSEICRDLFWNVENCIKLR